MVDLKAFRSSLPFEIEMCLFLVEKRFKHLSYHLLVQWKGEFYLVTVPVVMDHQTSGNFEPCRLSLTFSLTFWWPWPKVIFWSKSSDFVHTVFASDQAQMFLLVTNPREIIEDHRSNVFILLLNIFCWRLHLENSSQDETCGLLPRAIQLFLEGGGHLEDVLCSLFCASNCHGAELGYIFWFGQFNLVLRL